MTVRAVFESLLRDGPRSRAELSRDTGISAPTISKAIAELLERDLVSETLISENSLGRPGMRLTIARARSRVLAVSLCPNVAEVAVATLDGKIVSTTRFPTLESVSSLDLLNDLLAHLRVTISDTENVFIGIGVCRAGVTDRGLAADQNGSLHGWAEADLISAFSVSTGLPTVVTPSAHGLALAERLIGRARKLSDFILMDIGDDPSVGVFCDGQLLTGRDGLGGQLLIGSSALRSDSDCLQRIVDNMTMLMCLFNPAAVFLHGQPEQAGDEQLSRIRSLMASDVGGRMPGDCRIESSSVGITDAAVATIVDSVTKDLGPRLSVSLSGTV